MHIFNLPSDILMLINANLNQKSKFGLALTSKLMYEKCRHFRNSEVFDLVLTKQLGTFFQTTIINVRIALNTNQIDYNALYEQLNHFYYLSSLKVKFSDQITQNIAYSFISSIPNMLNSTLKLIVEDEHNNEVINRVLGSNRRKDVDLETREKKKDPSPIRQAIESVKKLKTLYFEQNETENVQSEDIPVPLHSLVDKNQYKLNDLNSSLLKNAESKEEAEENIRKIISPKLLESVIVFQKNWVFATQFEVYYRNNQSIDKSAMTTMMDRYPSNVVSKIKNKTEKGKAWFELSIFWGRYEMLVTGGICGSKMSNDVVPFLGSNVPLKELLVDGDSVTTEKIYVNFNADGIKSLFQVRNLRNWTKTSSSLEWTCISSKFYHKGFVTVDPLSIRSSTPMITIISIVLHHISRRKKFESGDYEFVLNLFKSSKALRNTPTLNRIKNFSTIKSKLMGKKSSKDLTFLADYMDNVQREKGNPVELIKAEKVVYLSGKLNAHVQKTNTKSLNCYRL